MRVYDGSREKANSGRAQQAIVGDVSESTRAWVKNALPGLAWDSTSVAINSLAQPSAYAIPALVETVAIERDSMPCVRFPDDRHERQGEQLPGHVPLCETLEPCKH